MDLLNRCAYTNQLPHCPRKAEPFDSGATISLFQANQFPMGYELMVRYVGMFNLYSFQSRLDHCQPNNTRPERALRNQRAR